MEVYEVILRTGVSCAAGASFGLGLFNAAVLATGLREPGEFKKSDLPEYRSRIKQRFGPMLYYATMPAREALYLLKAE